MKLLAPGFVLVQLRLLTPSSYKGALSMQAAGFFPPTWETWVQLLLLVFSTAMKMMKRKFICTIRKCIQRSKSQAGYSGLAAEVLALNTPALIWAPV